MIAQTLAAENELLRAKVEQLERALADHAVPGALHLSRSEACVFSLLMKRNIATKDMIMIGLYAERPDNDVQIGIVDVFICNIRAKLRAFGIQIETLKGCGYRLAPEMKAKVRDLMQQERVSA